VALGLEVFDSEVGVAVAIDELDDDDIVVEDGEGVVVGRMRIEVGIALMVDSVLVGPPDAVKIEVVLLEPVMATELLALLDEIGGGVELPGFRVAGGSLVVKTLEAVLSVGRGVLAALVCKVLLELSCVASSDAVEAALSAVEDVETLLEGTAATTCSPVFEALAATPGVIA